MAKIIHYRNKCIGCGVCYERQPSIWRMSKKDGKAVLLRAEEKKGIHIVTVNTGIHQTQQVAEACPVKIIKVL